MEPVYIIDALRSPVGKYGGKLSGVRPDDLLAYLVRTMMDRNPAIDPVSIEDVVIGDANQAGEDCRNVARMSALLAGLPFEVGGTTVNRLCASGMQAVMDAARGLACGEGHIYIAGGVESMSRAPFILPKSPAPFARASVLEDSTIGWRFANPRHSERFQPHPMGQTAELLAKQRGIGREEQDRYALSSHEKYFKALASGRWSMEMVPVSLGGSFCIADEQPRRTTHEALAKLRPLFGEAGTVTAGNSSPINDGAAVLLLASGKAVATFGLRPLARIASMAVAACHPDKMGVALVPAVRKALDRAGIGPSQLGPVELCESFAVQVLACLQDLAIDPDRVNPNGGSIAIGNPLGSTGARIVGSLAHQLSLGTDRYGLATMSVGLGQGSAIVLEKP